MFRRSSKILAVLAVVCASLAAAVPPLHWVTSWAASVQGPYPMGATLAQPNLSHCLSSPHEHATPVHFRLIVKPDIWGLQARFRLSNV